MWFCVECGTGGIAGSLEFCPHCLSPRPEPPAGTPAGEEGTVPAEPDGLTLPDAPQAPTKTKKAPAISDWGVKKDG